MDQTRLQIRELLLEEIARLKATGGISSQNNTEEVVSIQSDADLNAFAKRLIELCQDKGKRSDILSGNHRFKLSQMRATSLSESSVNHVAANSQQVPTHIQLNKGMITERDIGKLPQGTKSIGILKSTVFTPLARDEVGRRNINLQRIAS